MKPKDFSLIPADRIERAILFLRGHKVILDADLATLYGVTTADLNRSVTRNLERFPGDFMFQLTPEEFAILRCQFGISSSWGGRRFRPRAFTEQGIAMLSSVLRSKRAIQVNIQVVRTFVRLRAILASHARLAHRLDELEQKYDARFKVVFEAIRKLMAPRRPSVSRASDSGIPVRSGLRDFPQRYSRSARRWASTESASPARS